MAQCQMENTEITESRSSSDEEHPETSNIKMQKPSKDHIVNLRKIWIKAPDKRFIHLASGDDGDDKDRSRYL